MGGRERRSAWIYQSSTEVGCIPGKTYLSRTATESPITFMEWSTSQLYRPCERSMQGNRLPIASPFVVRISPPGDLSIWQSEVHGASVNELVLQYDAMAANCVPVVCGHPNCVGARGSRVLWRYSIFFGPIDTGLTVSTHVFYMWNGKT